MKSLWQIEFQVRSYEGDRTGLLKPHALLNYFEEAAQQHATELGFGYEQLKEAQQFWVLSRLHARIERAPSWGERVRLQTWPKSVSRLFALRDFLFYDETDAVLARATSAWLLMDAEKGRPLRPEQHLPEGPLLENADRHAIEEVPGKLTFSETEKLAGEEDVRFSDIDVNDHVNNSVYLRWLDDAVRGEAPDQELREFELNFIKEASFPMRIEIYRGVGSPLSMEVRNGTEPLMRGSLHYE